MEAPRGASWRAHLRGWRGGLFALLGLYALGVAVFLLAGGAQPAMTSLVAMEAEVESGEVGVAAGQTSPDDSASSQRTATDATEAASTAATTTEPPPACSDINPVDHGVNPGLTGVHALEFVTLEEQPAAFAGYEGCPLIVNFFASWCVPCVTEMPDFERFWNTHGTQVAVLGLAANDRLEDAIATVAERGVTYPTGLDEGELFIDFGGLGMPTTVFVSPQGQILETHSGLLTLEDITTRAEEHFGL
ncbi:TlpA family protein disulfide reductase [Candidatus Poriferisodalis sp.]|uniref:TlpA family protein disulfide reductase n=1 Tax=Candidatus Poriferisodalis sp. TaxID=3101277 RepID=UPI003B02B275